MTQEHDFDSTEFSADDFPSNRFPILVRQAFYQGVAQCCLKKAWLALDLVRENRTASRTFRGTFQERKGIPLMELANALGRSPGELSRWFQGQSPSWANLMMVMLPLNADWPELGNLPTKPERRDEGYGQAILFIRKYLARMGSRARDKDPPYPMQSTPPTPENIRHLEMLFSDRSWPLIRRQVNKRGKALARLSMKLDVCSTRLDSVDCEWGEAYVWLIHLYEQSLRDQLWL